MKLSIEEDKLQIKMNPLERVLCFRGYLRVPLDHITQVSAKRLGWHSGQIRAPGTHIPFLLKAGTYYGKQGKEFWWVMVGKPSLIIELKDWDYNRIVLSSGNNETWARRIEQAI